MFIFGYGSLMNPESLARTSVTARIVKRVTLRGYQRKANAMDDAFPEVAMNIVPSESSSIDGVLVDFPEEDLPALKQRETGYKMIDVTSLLDCAVEGEVFTFIAPDSSEYNGKKIRQEYLEVCLNGVPESEREEWLRETIIECGISEKPKDKEYRHA